MGVKNQASRDLCIQYTGKPDSFPWIVLREKLNRELIFSSFGRHQIFFEADSRVVDLLRDFLADVAVVPRLMPVRSLFSGG